MIQVSLSYRGKLSQKKKKMTATKKWFVCSVQTRKGSDDHVPPAPRLADGLTKGLKMYDYGFSAHTATDKPRLVLSLHYPLLD